MLMPSVNPAILKWARETAGLSLDDAAKAIGIKPTRLEELERGEREPSYSQLANMADKYRRPLITFYLRQPPPQGDRGEDFRRAPGSHPIEFDPQLDALIRNVRARHDVVNSLLEDEEVEPLTFIASRSLEDNAATVADSIRTTIGFDLVKFRQANDESAAFAYLRDCLERSGIFVLLLGNLGSHHSNISSTAFRGYAIADPIAPFIVINDNDARATWSFTSLHEAAHLWLGQTGISGTSHEVRIERFCNDVAGQLLLPRTELQEFQNLRGVAFENVLASISEFASFRNISRRMVAYQLLRADHIDSAQYQQLCDRFRDDWQRSKEKDPDTRKDHGGPNRYVVLRHRLGPALIGLARRSLDGGALSPTRASRLLGVKAGAVHSFLHPVPA
jgi:Zn-dependent peptidase ImmA (M78 family)/transcriptional regulator with XRE-family HTH domain